MYLELVVKYTSYVFDFLLQVGSMKGFHGKIMNNNNSEVF